MKRIRSAISCVLIMMLLFVFAGSTFAANERNEPLPFSDAYDALPDDAVVCYMMGQLVYKYEVDEYGFIHKNTTTTRNHSSYYTESRLPSSYRNRPVTAHGGMSTQGFYQHDTFIYMDEDTGEAMARKFEEGATADSILATIGGFLISLTPLKNALAAFIGLLMQLPAATRASIASQIRGYTDEHECCFMLEMRNSYGTFRAIHPWDGQYAIRYPQSLNPPSVAWVDGVAGYNGNTIWGASA